MSVSSVAMRECVWRVRCVVVFCVFGRAAHGRTVSFCPFPPMSEQHHCKDVVRSWMTVFSLFPELPEIGQKGSS